MAVYHAVGNKVNLGYVYLLQQDQEDQEDQDG